jgi:hypothetical protein
MKTLYHLCTDADNRPMTAVFVDGNGFNYRVPFDEPTEIQSSFMADKIIEHCHYYGIVEVRTTKTRSGIVYSMDDARARAIECLEISEKACINDYIKTQLEDRVRQNFPPLPPSGRALQCCIKHRYNLLKAGIRCIGWEPPYEMEDPGLQVTAGLSMPSNLMEMIVQMQAQLLRQNELINELMLGRTTNSGQVANKKKRTADNTSAGTNEAPDDKGEDAVQSVTL